MSTPVFTGTTRTSVLIIGNHFWSEFPLPGELVKYSSVLLGRIRLGRDIYVEAVGVCSFPVTWCNNRKSAEITAMVRAGGYTHWAEM